MTSTRNPWTTSQAVREVENARRRAERDPRRLQEYRQETLAKFMPRLGRLELEPMLNDLLLAYLGLDARERLLTRSELCLLPGLRNPKQHPRFCRIALWLILEGHA